ncbi:MAG: class I SAM-dependent methyltransferase [Anaerolineae bacterium]|nr:class I SAM-dependent methyltransferase [Anaerolineae bacterium]
MHNTYNTDRADNYFQDMRNEPLRYIPPGARRLLSIGCASGATEAMLKEKLGLEMVVGVEVEGDVAAQAAARLDAVHAGDIEALDLPYPPGHFDAVLCMDVLEHLRDPWRVLRATLGPLMAPGAVLVISVPNVRYWVVLWRLLWGRWDYARRGVLDIGHLRFFTPRTARRMLAEAGLEVIAVRRKYRLYDSLGDRIAGRVVGGVTRRLTNALVSLRAFDILFPLRDFFTYQIVMVAHKPGQTPL